MARRPIVTISDPTSALIQTSNSGPPNAPGIGLGGANLPASPPMPLPERDRYTPIVSSYDGIFSFSYRYPTFSLDPTLKQVGYRGVDRMLRMAACRSSFDLKRHFILKDGITVEKKQTADNSDAAFAQQLAEETVWFLNNIRDDYTDQTQDSYSVVFAQMMGMWTGNKASELVWKMQEKGPYDGYRMLKWVLPKKNEQIAFNVDPNTLRVNCYTSYTPGTGYDFYIPPENMLVYTHNETDGDPHGVGDWQACYKHWMMLDALLKYWSLAMERWGSPVLVVQMAAGDDNELRAAEDQLNRIRGGAPAILPDNIGKYELVTCPGDVFEAFERACRYQAEQIGMNVQGNTLSTGEGVHGATSAGSETHAKMGAVGYEADAERVCAVFNQLVRRFVRYNHGVAACEYAPSIRLCKPDAGQFLQTAQALDILIKDGNMPAASKIVREKLDLPPIDAEEEKLLADQKAAELEAQERLIDAKQSNKVAAMSDHDFERIASMSANAVYHRMQTGA